MLKVNTVLFAVASSRNLIYTLLIDIPTTSLQAYESLLNPLERSLDGIYGNGPIPMEVFGSG